MKIVRRISVDDFDSIVQSLPAEKAKDALRQLREKECYPIINRGTLWYNLLSESQKVELKEWYQAWLDITETLVKPKKPSWLY
jgi:hypothetical protein